MDRSLFVGVMIAFLTASATMNCASAQQPSEHTFTPLLSPSHRQNPVRQ